MKKKLLFFIAAFFVCISTIVKAQDAFMGYDYVTATTPLAWSINPTTFNTATNKEVVFSNSGGNVNNATVCNTSNISNYQLNSSTAYIEINLTNTSAASSISTFTFTGSSNSTTANTAKAGIVFCSSTTFSLTSDIISVVESDFAPASNGAWAPLVITPPAGTKSLRIYRRIFYNSSTGVASTSTATGFVQFGLGVTLRIASVAVNISTGSSSPTLQNSPNTLSFGNQAISASSASQTTNLSGTNLTGFPGNITVTSPSTDFQVSANNTSWGPTATIPFTAATITSTPIYVRFTPQSVGAKSGNVSISGGGASTINIAVSGTGTAAVSNYRSKQNGNWADASTWQYNTGTWVDAVTPPTDADGTITIQNGHTVTIATNTTADEVTVESGGTLAVNTGTTFVVANGTGTDVQVNGTFRNRGTVTLTGTMALGATSTYQHDVTTAIPTLTWTAGSTCLVTGGTGVPSGGFGQSFSNLTWNCANQTTQVVIATTGFTVNSNFYVISTGTGGIQLISSGGVQNSVVGSYTQDGGRVYIFPNTAARSFTCNGDFNLNGGKFEITGQGGSGSATLFVKGNMSVNGGELLQLTGTTANLELNGTSTQFLNLGGATLIDTINLTINNPAGITNNTPIVWNGNLTLTNGNLTTTLPALFQLTSNSTVNGGSATSYVNGPLRREIASTNSTALSYPIGRGGNYSPVILTVTQDAVTPTGYTVYSQTGSFSSNVSPASIQSVSDTRSYVVQKGGPANVTTAQIQLIYDANDASATGISVADRTRVRIVKDDGVGNWINIGANAGGSANNTGTITSDVNFTSFGEFAIANATASVPVKFVRINANKTNNGIAVNWQVADEVNIASYVLEQSANGTNFTSVASVNATNVTNYSALAPQFTVPRMLYRIKAIEKDGRALYSSIVSLKAVAETKNELSILPNPIKNGVLQIQLNDFDKDLYELKVTNVVGAVILNTKLQHQAQTANYSYTLPASITRGTYFITVSSNGKVLAVKQVIVE